MEKKVSEMVHNNKLVTTELLQDKKAHSEQVAKLENQISEGTSYTIKLQNEITKLTADRNSMKFEDDSRCSQLNDRIKQLEADVSKYRDDNKVLEAKKSEVQAAWIMNLR